MRYCYARSVRQHALGMMWEGGRCARTARSAAVPFSTARCGEEASYPRVPQAGLRARLAMLLGYDVDPHDRYHRARDI
jgi:hypothetical protein